MNVETAMRYARHMRLPGFGSEAQARLLNAHVAVVGAGGLGCPVLHYLTAAGVGTITIVDDDTVDETNLQRQVLFAEADVGQSKAQVAAARLRLLNAHVKIVAVAERLTAANALTQLAPVDVIVDCTDNFPSRYLLCDASVLLNKPLVFGSVFRFEGQVSVFNYRGSPCYRDLHPQPPAPGSVPDCAEGGVLGSLCGVIGSYMANETLKLITGLGQPLAGSVLWVDSLQSENYTFHIPARGAAKSITQLIDYDHFCSVLPEVAIRELSVDEWQHWQSHLLPFVLVDVREPHEYATANLGGISLPLSALAQRMAEIPRDTNVVVHCQSGTRSRQAIMLLQTHHHYSNLYNLTGGLNACLGRA